MVTSNRPSSTAVIGIVAILSAVAVAIVGIVLSAVGVIR